MPALSWGPSNGVSGKSYLAEELLDRLSLQEDELDQVLYKDIGRSTLVSNILEQNSKLTLINQVVKPFKRVGAKLRDTLASDLPQFVRSGFDSLDRVLGGGIRTNTITQIIGPPQTGKSTLAHMVMKSFLEDNRNSRKGILYISPTVDETLLKLRVIPA